MTGRVTQAQWARLSELIAEVMGLDFPPERQKDLERGVAAAAQELGYGDTAACVEGLLAAGLDKARTRVLASHLTIGETYFFRERPTIAALAEHILPELIGSRRGREQRLRFWSAACCTGEEPYTLAILLHQLLPDLDDWQITISATDINASFLAKAVAGVYGEWSFRDTPEAVRRRYFTRTPEGYALAAEVKKLVRFQHLNLIEDSYPTLATDTNAMDLILCRNVLMYFTAKQVRRVAGKLHGALVEGGWLLVSPSEASHRVFSDFATVNRPGVILYRKRPCAPQVESPWLPPPLEATPEPQWSAPPAPRWEPPPQPEPPPAVPAEMTSANQASEYPSIARALANRGRLEEALAYCEKWIAHDKLNAAAHYLHGMILMERGDIEEGRSSFARAIYLEPDFVLAHYALGNIARAQGHAGEARRHFANALHLTRGYAPADLLPESDGLTAGRLTETLNAMNTS